LISAHTNLLTGVKMPVSRLMSIYSLDSLPKGVYAPLYVPTAS
jgi:hypothetical protein